MNWIPSSLLAVAALLLILPAILVGSTMYAIAVAVVSAAGVALLRSLPSSKWAHVLLIINSAMATFALFLGIHPVFPVIALTLMLYAWNAGQRFGHLDAAPTEEAAKRQFILQTLSLSLIPAVAIGLLVSAFLYVRLSLSFSGGMALSVAVLLVLALWLGVARMARNHHDTPPRT